MDGVIWKKSRRSGPNGGDCVEVADLRDTIGVRDSKDRSGPVLRFERDAWRAFVDGLSNPRV